MIRQKTILIFFLSDWSKLVPRRAEVTKGPKKLLVKDENSLQWNSLLTEIFNKGSKKKKLGQGVVVHWSAKLVALGSARAIVYCITKIRGWDVFSIVFKKMENFSLNGVYKKKLVYMYYVFVSDVK